MSDFDDGDGLELSPKSAQSDNLRTRIAAAISGVDDWRGVTDPTILADAVIRELGLKRDRLGADIGYPHQQYRYVTGWMSDE